MTVLLNKTIVRKIKAGGSEHFVSAGRYLYLESATPPVASRDLLLTVDDVVQGFIAPGVGYEAEPDQQFSTFRVQNTTGAEVTVLVIVGFGRIIDNRFVASGTVAVQGVANGTPVAVALYGSTLGASRASVTSVAVNSSLALVTSAANVSGLVLRAAGMITSGSGAAMLADTVSPLLKGDGHNLLMASSGQGIALAYPVLVPAGLGIYTRNDGAGTIAAISYDLL